MDIIIGLLVLGGVIYYVYNKVMKTADVNNDGKVDSKDAEIAVDMAVTSVGGFAAGAAVSVAQAVETKFEEVKVEGVKWVNKAETAVVEEAKEATAELVKAVETKVEEVTKVVEEAKETTTELVKAVETKVNANKRGRKSKSSK